MGDVRRIWPGYLERSDRALLLYTQDQATLITWGSSVPPGFLPTRSSGAAPGRARVWTHRGPLAGLVGNIDLAYQVGPFSAAAVPFDSTRPDPSLEVGFHEAFHSFQAEQFAPLRGPGGRTAPAQVFADAAPKLSDDFWIASEVERRLLARALETGARTRADSLLRDYLAVRHHRGRMAGPAVVEAEREVERQEGSAEYVGRRAIALVDDEPVQTVRKEVAAALTSPVPGAESDSVRPGELLRSRVYGTGSALGLLLDDIEPAWRRRLQDGWGFDQILATALAFDSTRAEARARAALASFPDVAVPLAVRTAAATPADSAVARAFSRSGARLVLDFIPGSSGSFTAPDVNYSAGLGGVVPVEDGLVLLTNPPVFSLRTPHTVVTARDAPVLIDVRSAPDLVRIVVGLPDFTAASVRVAAEGVLPGMPFAFEDGELQVHASKVLETTVAADSVVLRLPQS